MIIFRIENPITNNGMWYDKDGNFSPFILNLSEGISKDLPMGYCEDHKRDGLEWYSAGKSKAGMNQWFSARDAYELMNNGYSLYQFNVSEFQIKEHEVLFTREGIIDTTEIPLDSIWDMTQV